MNRRIILMVLIMVSGNIIFGQFTYDRFSFSPKIGVYNSTFLNSSGGLVIGGEVNTSFNNIAYSMDYYRFEEISYFSYYPNEHYSQMGFMIGKNHDSENKKFSIQTLGGLAPIWGIERTDFIRESRNSFFRNDIYDTEKFLTLGLALKLGFELIPTNFLGIGFDIQANINNKRTVVMFMLSIELGKLR